MEQNFELLEKLGFFYQEFAVFNRSGRDPAKLGDWQGGKVFQEILKQLEEEMEVMLISGIVWQVYSLYVFHQSRSQAQPQGDAKSDQ
jgi:hypothetical protein